MCNCLISYFYFLLGRINHLWTLATQKPLLAQHLETGLYRTQHRPYLETKYRLLFHRYRRPRPSSLMNRLAMSIATVLEVMVVETVKDTGKIEQL